MTQNSSIWYCVEIEAVTNVNPTDKQRDAIDRAFERSKKLYEMQKNMDCCIGWRY